MLVTYKIWDNEVHYLKYCVVKKDSVLWTTNPKEAKEFSSPFVAYLFLIKTLKFKVGKINLKVR